LSNRKMNRLCTRGYRLTRPPVTIVPKRYILPKLTQEKTRTLVKTAPVGFIAVAVHTQTILPDVQPMAVPIAVLSHAAIFMTVNPLTRKINSFLNLAIGRNQDMMKIVGILVFFVNFVLIGSIVSSTMSESHEKAKTSVNESPMDKSVRAKLGHWFAKEMYLTQKDEIKSRFVKELDDLRQLRKRMDELEESNYGQMIPKADSKIIGMHMRSYLKALEIAHEIELDKILASSPIFSDAIRKEVVEKSVKKIEEKNAAKLQHMVFGYLEEMVAGKVDPSTASTVVSEKVEPEQSTAVESEPSSREEVAEIKPEETQTEISTETK